MCTNLPLRYSRCALFCTAHRLHFFMYVFYRFCCFSEVLMSTVPRLCSTFFKSTLSAGNHCTMYKFIRGLSTGDHVFVHCVHCKNVQRWTFHALGGFQSSSIYCTLLLQKECTSTWFFKLLHMFNLAPGLPFSPHPPHCNTPPPFYGLRERRLFCDMNYMN